MKKQVFVFTTIVGFLMLLWLPCFGGAKPDYQLLEKYFSQDSNAFSHLNKLPDFNQKKHWKKKRSHDEPLVNLYVNCDTGKDKPRRGLSHDKPFKTISYAVSRVPFIRSSSDFYVSINIAQGTYNESVLINYDRIILLGEGSDSTLIVGPEGDNTIDISGSNNCEIHDLKVIEGVNGINIIRSSVLISDTIAENSTMGISASMNSTLLLNNCEANNNYYGLNITENSQTSIMGEVLINTNSAVGIAVFHNSNVTISRLADVLVSNNLYGFSIHSASSVLVEGSASLSTVNNFFGTWLSAESSMSIFGGTCIYSDNGFGYLVSESSVMITVLGRLLIENSGIGMALTKNSSLSTNLWGNLTVQNNNTGLFINGGDMDFSLNSENIITDNLENDIGLVFGARASFLGGSTIGSISCDDTVLVEGNYSCPDD